MARHSRNPAPHRRLNSGETGADVRKFQEGLNARAKQRGWKSRVKVDGEFGASTLSLYRKVAYAIGLPKGLGPTVAAQRAVRWPWTRSRAAKKRAEERRPKRPVKGQLTENFHISEFNCHDGTPVPAYMEDDLRALCQRVLEPLRAEYGPAVINSGYRPTAYNASIGGEPNSFHIYDVRKSQPAADSRYARGNPTAWGATAKARLWGPGGGVGIYPSSGFIHCDTRTYRSEWWG